MSGKTREQQDRLTHKLHDYSRITGAALGVGTFTGATMAISVSSALAAMVHYTPGASIVLNDNATASININNTGTLSDGQPDFQLQVDTSYDSFILRPLGTANVFNGYTTGTGAYRFVNRAPNVSSNTTGFTTDSFNVPGYMYFYSGLTSYGVWNDATRGLALVKFDTNPTLAGSLLSGYIDMQRTGGNQLTIYGWGYNDVPDANSIHYGAAPPPAVPEPGTLSLLAMGAAGLGAWRSRRRRNAEREERA